MLPEISRVAERPSSLADRITETTVKTAGKAVLWKAAELTANAVAPGAGLIVRVTKITVDFRGAVKTYEEGKGFRVNIPLTDLPGRDFSASLRFRVFAEDPPPGLPADLAIDYVSTDGRLDKFNVIEGADLAPANEAAPQGTDLDPLFRHTQRLSAAARSADSDPSESSVAYLHQPTRTGRVVVQPPGKPARCEAWFTYKLSLSLAGPSERGRNCPNLWTDRVGQARMRRSQNLRAPKNPAST